MEGYPVVAIPFLIFLIFHTIPKILNNLTTFTKIMTEDENVTGGSDGCCGNERKVFVAAIVTIDDRGQMVLPKEIRDRMGLKAGDKLALSILETGGKACCVNLVRADELADLIKGMIGQVV